MESLDDNLIDATAEQNSVEDSPAVSQETATSPDISEQVDVPEQVASDGTEDHASEAEGPSETILTEPESLAAEEKSEEESDFNSMLQERELFKAWNEVKTDINEKSIVRNVKEGEIYWCSVGKNIGVEINGKHETFSRPVIVLKKLSRFGFMGIPLTSQKHTGNWYASFEFKDKTEYAVLAQARVFSVSRLGKRMGMLPDSDLATVKEAFRKLYF